jgi:hypothetical protein
LDGPACPSAFGHTLKKFLIQLNDKLDDPNAKAYNRKNKTDIPTLTICVSTLVAPRYFDEECHITESW